MGDRGSKGSVLVGSTALVTGEASVRDMNLLVGPEPCVPAVSVQNVNECTSRNANSSADFTRVRSRVRFMQAPVLVCLYDLMANPTLYSVSERVFYFELDLQVGEAAGRVSQKALSKSGCWFENVHIEVSSSY